MLNRFFYNFILTLLLGTAIGCSSGGGGGEDTDIAEIKEIEQTGEFSEDEFFSSEGIAETQEEQLVDDVPGLEDDLNISEESGEQPLGDDLALDVALEGTEDDLFDDAGFGEEITASEESSIGENVEVESEDLDSLLSEDLGGEDFGSGADDVLATNQNATGEAPLELDTEEDLFRDIDEPLATSEENTDDLFSSDDPVVDTTTPGDSMASGGSYSDTAQSEMSEDIDVVSPDEYGFNNDVLAEDKSASDLLAEDISVDDVDYGSYGEPSTPVATEKTYIPVKKMRTVPYTKNGVLVNAIYFVRQGDSLNSIGQKIYGSGSGVDFTIVNPHLKSGNLKVGQKVYYNSPQRPQDNSRLLTYYQDVQAPMLTYAARESENIRDLSENLLGHPRSWMEVWATNMEVESKWALEAPYQIRYWKGGGFNPTPAAQPTLAQNDSSFDNQANLDMAPEENPFDNQNAPAKTEPETSPFETDLAMDDTSFDDTSSPANAGTVNNDSGFNNDAVAQDDAFNNPVDNELDAFAPDLAAEEPVMDAVPENDPFAATDAQEDPAMAENAQNPRDVARNESGGFQAQSQGGLMDDPMKLGIIGGALLLLLLVGYMVVKRRKETDDIVEMQSFDFGGETMIDEEANKTQIDI